MGILFITWNFPPRRGGIENLMDKLVAGLTKRHSVHVITAHVRERVSDESGVLRAPWPGLIPFACYALWRGAILLMRDPQIMVVFGGSAMVAPLVFLLARLFGRKAIVQAHGLDLVYKSTLYQALCVRWLKYCDRTVANSNYTASLAVQRGVSPRSISVIPLGVDTARFAPAANCGELKEEFGLAGRNVILFVGRLARRKGVKEFIQNCLPIIARDAPDSCFVVAGSNPAQSLAHRDDLLSEIRASVSELGLEDHTRILGEINDDELVKLYQCCNVVVLPALASAEDVEGFGLVLLEAAAAAKPVIATRVGGIPDAVADGKSGILREPGDYQGISQSVIELLTDKKRRAIMGEFARQRVQKKFSWEMIVARYDQLFDCAVFGSADQVSHARRMS
jgi:phosphatidylinositol alpha-1,6-mannosyltransferase